MATETLRINITADNKAAIGGITQVKNTVDGLTESIKVYQDKAFAEKDLAKLKVYNREIQALQAQLKQTTNVGKIGFDEMGVAIKGGSGAINKAFTGLRQIAYIIPGLGIAGIFNLAFEAIGSAAKQLDLFSSKEKDAAKAAAEFNKELLKQVETGAQEISHLKALESVASNSSLSIEKRKQAVKELRDQYPAYFKDLTDEEILTGKVTKVTDQLTNAIYKRAEARAREADIAKKATQVFANQQQIELLDLEIAKQKKIASERSVLKKVGTSGGVNEISGSDIQYQSESKLRDLQVERNKLYLETEGIKIDVEKDQRRINKLQGDTIQLGEKETKVLKDRRNPLEHEKKGLVDINKELDEYLKLHYKMVALGANQIVQTTRSKETEKSMRDVAPPKTLNDGGVFGADFAKIADQRKQALDDFNKSLAMSASLANFGANAFASMFDAMAKGESIGDAIANVFKDLVKQLAMMVAKAITFAVILNVITGGQYSIGKIFTGALGGNFTGKGYAQGGLSTGPKSGHMELLHGNEWVLRPEQLNGALMAAKSMGSIEGGGTGTQRIEVVGKIAGQDIWLSKQRTDYNRGLTT